jgi:DNA ligase (NAD+)
LVGLEGFKERSIGNLLGAIDDSRTRPLHRLLVGLGIRHLGQVGAVALARDSGDVDAIMAASEDRLAAIDGVGPVIASSVASWFASPVNRSVVDRLRAGGVNMLEPDALRNGPDSVPEQTLTGQSVVVTGTLEGYTREQAEAAITDRGGKSPGTVSKRTFAVVVGEAPGAAKLAKAQELGVPILDGAQFDTLLRTGELPG